jgi:hypothetical protein
VANHIEDYLIANADKTLEVAFSGLFHALFIVTSGFEGFSCGRFIFGAMEALPFKAQE